MRFLACGLVTLSIAVSALASGTASAQPLPSESSEVTSAHPATQPYDGPIEWCRTDRHFECVVDVSYRSGRNPWRNATRLDDEGALWLVRAQRQDIPVRLGTNLKTPALEPSGSDWFTGILLDVKREPDGDNPMLWPDDVNCDPSQLETCVVYGPALPDGLKVRVTIRTSWLRPVFADGWGEENSIRTTPVDGGSLWTFTGEEVLAPLADADWPDRKPVPSMTPHFGFMVTHADPAWDQTILSDDCVDFGFPTTYSNGTWGGPPMWDAETQAIDFNKGAPHRNVDGSLYRGVFVADIPTDWIECRWGLPRFRATDFRIEVTSEDGEDVPSTRSLRVRKRTLSMVVTGFHYSSPTISLVRKIGDGQ